jgi:hypothetical protein
MQENNPIRQSLIYELTRQNHSILMELKEAHKTIAKLSLERCVMKDSQLDLVVRLEKANEKIHQLNVKQGKKS